jgi:4-amino-4-deoxy-L-arabinose transferase-like glycosyltransferase
MSRPVNWAAGGLAALTLIRLFVASVAPLAPDETYYWVWSHALAAGYLDHPPMVALWIRAGTTLAGEDAIGVRLLGPFAAAIGSLLVYDTAERLFPKQGAGVVAAALLNATLVLGVGAVIMTPDTPLLLFWTATLWAGARLARDGAPAWWLAAGVFAGLAMVSKYTGAFLPIGLGLFAAIAMPRALLRPEPWVGLLIAGVLFLPVVLWNAQHDWAGFLRQGGRVADWQPERAVQFLAELVGGQIGLATPGVFVLIVAGIALAIRETVRSRDPAWTLLAAMTVPPILVFVQHAVGDRVEGNWPAIVFPSAVVGAAGLAGPGWRRWTWPSCVLGCGVTAGIYAYVLIGAPALPGGRDPVARQLFAWNDLAARADTARQTVHADFIAAEPYGLASELAWALPTGADVVGTGSHWGPGSQRGGSHSALTTLQWAETGDRYGLLIRPVRYGGSINPDDWRDSTRLPDIARIGESGEIERYAVFLVRSAGGRSPGVLLPRRGVNSASGREGRAPPPPPQTGEAR